MQKPRNLEGTMCSSKIEARKCARLDFFECVHAVSPSHQMLIKKRRSFAVTSLRRKFLQCVNSYPQVMSLPPCNPPRLTRKVCGTFENQRLSLSTTTFFIIFCVNSIQDLTSGSRSRSGARISYPMYPLFLLKSRKN